MTEGNFLNEELLEQAREGAISAKDAQRLLLTAGNIQEYRSLVSVAIATKVDMATVAYPDALTLEVLFARMQSSEQDFIDAANVFAQAIVGVEDLLFDENLE